MRTTPKSKYAVSASGCFRAITPDVDTLRISRHYTKKLALSLFASIFISLCCVDTLQANASQKTLPVNLSNVSTVNLKSNNKKEKPRIAVLDFDHSSVASNWFWWWKTSAKGVSDILVNKLVESGKFRVIERSRLDAILAEQNLGASGRVDASTAAQIGRILGVDAVVIGSVTEFNVERGGGGIRLSGLRVGGKKTKANVKLNLRLVDTSTAEILMTAQGDGKSSNTGGSISLSRVGVDTSSRKEAKLITNAVVKAIDKVAEKISNNSTKLAANSQAAPIVNGIVADVSGNTIILNKGKGDGYSQGIKLSVERVTKTVKDPLTGKVIRQITQPVGKIEVTEVDAQSSVAKIVSGRGFKVGDVAKPVR